MIFGAKAAPGYWMAKLIIKLINAVADASTTTLTSATGSRSSSRPTSMSPSAERIYPAADLSEQISLAGKEASGTGNMKFALNGALTIGTLDGANVEIRELVGPENFFLFGLTEEQVAALRETGYAPRRFLAEPPGARAGARPGRLRRAFAGGARPLPSARRRAPNEDRYLVLADYASYAAQQEDVERAYRDPEHWTRLSILNTARSGYFSSDRSIREYRDRIWKVGPLDGIA